MPRSNQSRAKKPVVRRALTPTMAAIRSRVSNGAQLFVGNDIDERGAWCRRLRDLMGDHVSDLGGAEMISAAEMVLVRRAAMLCLQTELMEHRWAQNEGEASPKQIETYQRTVNTLRRTLEALGLKRRQRDVTPSLQQYMRMTPAERAKVEA